MSAKTSWYISELHPKYKNKLENTKKSALSLNESEKAKAREYIRGYLKALEDVGEISPVQFRVLYIYYTSNL